MEALNSLVHHFTCYDHERFIIRRFSTTLAFYCSGRSVILFPADQRFRTQSSPQCDTTWLIFLATLYVPRVNHPLDDIRMFLIRGKLEALCRIPRTAIGSCPLQDIEISAYGRR
jgi:hypothetical protein